MQIALMAPKRVMREPSDASLKLKTIRTSLRYSQAQFAQILGVERDTYKNWEYSTEPPQAIMDKAISMGRGYQQVELRATPLAPIPVVGAVSAGPGSNIHPDMDQIWVPTHMAQYDSCGWEAEGDSMMPWIQAGDIVVAKDHKVARAGYPFMIRRADGSASVKILAYHDGSWYYKSLNPSYPEETAEGTLLGYVIGIYRIEGTLETIQFDPSGLRPKNFF